MKYCFVIWTPPFLCYSCVTITCVFLVRNFTLRITHVNGMSALFSIHFVIQKQYRILSNILKLSDYRTTLCITSIWILLQLFCRKSLTNSCIHVFQCLCKKVLRGNLESKVVPSLWFPLQNSRLGWQWVSILCLCICTRQKTTWSMKRIIKCKLRVNYAKWNYRAQAWHLVKLDGSPPFF